MITAIKAEIKEIDRATGAIHRQLRSLETIDLTSAASWQDAWDKHPALHEQEVSLYRQRGELQHKLAIAEYEALKNREPKRNRDNRDRRTRQRSRMLARLAK